MEPDPVRVTFTAGDAGEWRIDQVRPVIGEVLPAASRLSRREGRDFTIEPGAAFRLDGVRSNDRYVQRAEKTRLAAISPDLGRAGCARAALIPIRKSAAWWALAQDERRAIFEERSHHIGIGLDYLPPVARRLYHCRDLGSPFDFLTWFEFAPGDVGAFDDLVGRLRETEEWRYVDREVDVRLVASSAASTTP